jgi:hypothetical protein
MRSASQATPSSPLERVFIWLRSLFLAVCFFSLFLSRGVSVESVVFIFEVTITFALPSWFFYLPRCFY